MNNLLTIIFPIDFLLIIWYNLITKRKGNKKMNDVRLMELILAISETEGFCENCPAWNNCGKGKVCEEVLYNWVKKEN